MKKYFFISLVLLFSLSSKAQIDLSVNYNNTHSGNSILLIASKKLNAKYELGGGVRYNINSLNHSDDQANVFKNRLYATKPFQFIGIDGFVHRSVFSKWEKVKPFIFYDLQLAYSTTRNRSFIPVGQGLLYGEPEYLYIEDIVNFGPFLWMEQNIGIGFKVDLFNSFYLTQRIGLGADLFFGSDDQLMLMRINKFSWEFGGLINVGIGMRL